MRKQASSDDALIARQEMQDYLTDLGFTITIKEIEKGHFHYLLEGKLAQQVELLMEVLNFSAHGHWKIEGGTTCQD